ncbi:MAG: hypothetical protein U9R39_11090 [Campylobacterota bacterium]|nr:hypothetical protein [Campylobacterota bacterium]
MDTKSLEDFKSLFSFTPSISILSLNNDTNKINESLNQFVSPYNGNVTSLDTEVLKILRAKVKRSSYDYAVVHDAILKSEDKNILMKIISSGIRDSGYIIFLEEKDKSFDEIYNLLEEFDYGAVSSIDIFENYNLIIGKKLHMWGMD